MEQIKRLINLGDGILDTVNSAVQSENYRTLSRDIKDQIDLFFGKETTYTNYSRSYSDFDKSKTTYFSMKKPNSGLVTLAIAVSIVLTVLSSISCIAIGLTGFLLGVMMLVVLSMLLIVVAAACLYFFAVNELAEYAGERYDETLLNLHNMIDDGMLPYARFDDEFKTLILTDEMYSRYSYIKRYRNSPNVSVDVKDEKLQAQMAVAIREDGEAFLKDVDICKNLAGDEFDIKTECFNRIIEKIFNYLDEVPSSANELYVLMNSYIKAIRKLLFAYTNLEKDDASNTWSIKLEISEAIDEINDVFETNIDKLYK